MKNTVVIDANIALKWVLNEPDSSIATALAAEWTKKGTIVVAPSLLMYETTNILYREVRAGRITAETARNGINIILRGVILLSSQQPTLSLRSMALATRFGLPTTYDTYYLALAESEGCELWTADIRMWRAVKDVFDWVHNTDELRSETS